jgi:hypothetical protein
MKEDERELCPIFSQDSPYNVSESVEEKKLLGREWVE